MATKPDRWYFSREELLQSPTIKCGVDPEKELSYRQQAANLIQDMGQRLQVYQLCINTAIVYMHRFYMFHSFTKFPRNSIAAASLFLAAKVEEQPHKLEHVIRVSHACLHRGEPPLDPRSNAYAQQAQELVINESIILQTLGFEVGVVHPHTHVVKCTQMIRASKDLSQSSYFLATNSLHLTTFSLKYKPTVVACVCIHLASKWTQYTIPKSNDGKGWWEYVDQSVTEEHLNDLTREFLNIIDRCPLRLKKRIMGYKDKQANTNKDSKKQKADGALNSTNTQQPQQAAGSSQGSVDSGVAACTSVDTFDYSFDSKPATGFDQYSDSEESRTEESSQKSDKTSKDKSSAAVAVGSIPKQEQTRKPETVKVSYEEYKRKEKERRERELQIKKQQAAASRADKAEITSHTTSRPVHKDARYFGHDKLVPGVGVKERLAHGHDKYSSGHDRLHPSLERTHTGHDRLPSSRDKRALGQEKLLPGFDRMVPGHEKVHSGQTRGPSGPERLLSGQERSASGREKASASLGKVPSTSTRPPEHEKSQKLRPQDKVNASLSNVDLAKRLGSGDQRDKREQKKPEMLPTALLEPSKDIASILNVRMQPSGTGDVAKEHKDETYAQAVKGIERSDKLNKKHRHEQHQPHHPGQVVKQTHSERTSKSSHAPQQVPRKAPLQEVKQEPPSEDGDVSLEMFNEINAELLKDLHTESLTTMPISLSNPVPENIKMEPGRTEPQLTLESPLFEQVISPLQNSVKPIDKSYIKLNKGDESDARLPELGNLVNPRMAGMEERKESHEGKRDHRDRREEREKRRDGHKSKRDEKKHHRSHKHRHHSPSSSRKHTPDIEVAEATGDMAPAKKQKLDQADSPHTVLTTSQGIRLKIKGLSNSFNNGSDSRNGKESEKMSNANSDSPGSLSMKINLSKINSPHGGSTRESSKDKDVSNHHRSHQKHKSRHHRSKDGHHKRSRSPAVSSASDASPAISPSKKRTPDTLEMIKPSYPNQSLLTLPMPPVLVRPPSRHSSPSKHSKRKRESHPPQPPEDVPPPPPPPHYLPLSTVTDLPPMQFHTIDASELFGDFRPPLPSSYSQNSRPPPPPPVPPSQKRPPLPP